MITKKNWWMWWTGLYAIIGVYIVFKGNYSENTIPLLQMVWVAPMAVYALHLTFGRKSNATKKLL